ncbi:aldehyde dehydrogenase family protein [Niallia nealsonii]|uniref:Aldehyde dehydrogenase family protein n=1 Tax=Niallia nealsonii TaxID=115979 RepID=A0A2N0Z6Y2_9BACI|nr:aldehyde dehydrogenase family protein [Niallia nealsonii]PKG25278.1 aldehyde dehydrogenase family protein [Niallia nealsonii]
MNFYNYINGEWMAPSTNEFVANLSPHDQSELDAFPDSAEIDMEMAANAAKNAFVSWSRLSYQQRGDYLLKASFILQQKLDEVAIDLTKEEGKTLAEAKGEINRAISTLQYYAAEANQPIGDVISSRNPKMIIFTKRVPIGPVGLITPWNFPIAIPAWKMAPALVYGNTVVIKPAESVPKSTYHLVECLHEAGIPAGVVNCVFGLGSVLGNAMIENPSIKAISFTGSNAVGNAIREKASLLGKPVQLELGGKNPLVVLKDADIDLAVESTINDAFLSTGQKCTATSRVIVESEIYELFREKLMERTNELIIGDPMDEETFLGPSVSEKQQKSVLSMIEQGKKEAKLLTGGTAVATVELNKGHYVIPTIFELESQQVEIARKEVFGPVVSLMKVNSFEEALEVANDTDYGLSAGIFTRDMSLSQRFIDEIEAGMVHINSGTVATELQAPFGGIKSSSFGPREQGKAAIEFYTKIKTVYYNSN